MESEGVSAYVRPYITILMVTVFCYLAVVGTIGPEVFVPTVTMVVVYWFKSREEEKKGEQIIAQMKEVNRG